MVSTTLQATSFPQWSQDIGYQKTQIYPLVLTPSGCPFVDVDVSGTKVSLMLDSGTARGLVITNNASSIPHRVEERIEELNPDGSHRGESFRIAVFLSSGQLLLGDSSGKWAFLPEGYGQVFPNGPNFRPILGI